MKIKKQIKKYYDSMQIPLAEKVLPKDALVDRRPKTSARPALKLATAIVCVGVIAVSLIVGLNRPPEIVPIIEVSEGVSENRYSTAGDESVNTDESEPKQTDESYNYISNTPDTSNDPDTSNESDASDNSDVSGGAQVSQQPDISEPDYSDVSSTVQNYPSGTLTVYTDPEAGEFAGDMYRPDGYHQNIGSALALMMHYTPEDNARFNVLIYTWADVEMEKTILNVNETISDDISLEQLSPIEVEGDNFENLKRYHVYLTKEQINALAENQVKCMYIGSGIGEYKDINWETAEGIKTYCEIHGDMYTFNKNGVLAEPDIFIEE